MLGLKHEAIAKVFALFVLPSLLENVVLMEMHYSVQSAQENQDMKM